MRGISIISKFLIYTVCCLLLSIVVYFTIYGMKIVGVISKDVPFDLFVSYNWVVIFSFLSLVIYTIIKFVKDGKRK